MVGQAACRLTIKELSTAGAVALQVFMFVEQVPREPAYYFGVCIQIRRIAGILRYQCDPLPADVDIYRAQNARRRFFFGPCRQCQWSWPVKYHYDGLCNPNGLDVDKFLDAVM